MAAMNRFYQLLAKSVLLNVGFTRISWNAGSSTTRSPVVVSHLSGSRIQRSRSFVVDAHRHLTSPRGTAPIGCRADGHQCARPSI
jgi:hypothetical protein